MVASLWLLKTTCKISGEFINVKFDKISQFQLEESFSGVIAAGLVHTYPDYKGKTITNYDSKLKTPFVIEHEPNHECQLSLIHKDKLKAHVAYIPKDRVVGLSKLARIVEVFSKRLQTQERLTMQIAKTIMESLDAKGVAVTIDSTHQCMTMRGIKKEQASTVTNYYLGQFREDLSYQNRYLRFISIAKD